MGNCFTYQNNKIEISFVIGRCVHVFMFNSVAAIKIKQWQSAMDLQYFQILACRCVCHQGSAVLIFRYDMETMDKTER